MGVMFCVECAKDRAKNEDARYVYNGKSLCYLHFWEEVGRE